MKHSLLILFISLYGSLISQTKEKPLQLNKFTVNKTGKLFLSYSYFETSKLQFNIETKKRKEDWKLARAFSEFTMVEKESSKIITKTDTTSLQLTEGVKKVRITFTDPKTKKPLTKTVRIH